MMQVAFTFTDFQAIVLGALTKVYILEEQKTNSNYKGVFKINKEVSQMFTELKVYCTFLGF